MAKRITKREAAIRADEEFLLAHTAKRQGRELDAEDKACVRRLAEDMHKPMTAEERNRQRRIRRRIGTIAHLF